jgi:lysophospholipase L1-like esterase
MSHVVLLGDSIFDNAAYVPGRPCVVEQVRSALPEGWKATLAAVDGDTVADVPRQLANLPPTATHLVLSVGGNDALRASGMLNSRAATVGEAVTIIAGVVAEFADAYTGLVRRLAGLGKPLTVCTVYDGVPDLGVASRGGLVAFNDVIIRAAFAARLPLIDLRLVCTETADYSPLSPIEPSEKGGAKIAAAIADAVTQHDFAARRTAVWV